MLTNKKIEKILQLLDRLAKKTAKEIPIVVEGKNDVSTLHKLNVRGDFISAKASGRSLLDVLHEIERREKNEVILLMDFDRRGRELTKFLTRHLEKMKIKTDLLFWNRLRKLVGREVKDVEGLASYLESLNKKLNKGKV